MNLVEQRDWENDPRLQAILRALEGLEYGCVQITVHDSQILQIDRTEKFRFAAERASAESRSKKAGATNRTAT